MCVLTLHQVRTTGLHEIRTTVVRSAIAFCLLFSESVLFLFAPHIHHLPVLVHLHGVVHQPIHVDELDALLLGIEQHRRNDGQLPHLLLCVLTHTQTRTRRQQSGTVKLQRHVTL